MDSGRAAGGEEDAWQWATWAGARRLQHLEFLALPFREKMRIVEQLSEAAEWFAERRAMRTAREAPDGGARGESGS